MAITRAASHAGSWYTDDATTLSKQLDGYLSLVHQNIQGIGSIPQPGARVIIAPHAGYSYSGPTAAWAYKSLDLSKATRIFLLGPSHHIYLSTCALSQCTTYSTPLGSLPLDTDTLTTLSQTGQFAKMSLSTDQDEHSLEMQLPYLHKALSLTFASPDKFPPLVPILVGSLSPVKEREFGKTLAPYLEDPGNIFIISSDFCHWGDRFNYTFYLPSLSSLPREGINLRPKDKAPSNPTIHESIGRVDHMAIEAIESGVHEDFSAVIRDTRNTVCGRHPIGVMMAAIEVWRDTRGEGNRKTGGLGGEGSQSGTGEHEKEKGRFRFVRYERSSDCVRVGDSSVSYASAFAVL